MRHQVIALAHDDLDVTDPARVERLITRERPGAVINCAAWTNVDGAEESEHEASLVNAQGAGFVADAASKVDAKVIYPSTDYVFNGQGGPYGESDDPDPINAYGRTKLGGERATALVNGRSFIVRTSWLFGPARRQLRRDDAAARPGRRTRWSSSTIRLAAPPTRATSRSACCA